MIPELEGGAPLSARTLWTKWDGVHDIHHDANACFDGMKDKDAWVDVTRLLLRKAGFCLYKDNILEINTLYVTQSRSIGGPEIIAEFVHRQTQNINEDFLPIYSRSDHERPDIISKGSDIALAIVPAKGSPARTILNKACRRHWSLSQMMDVHTSSFPLVCGIEVRDKDGHANEAVARLAIWTAAGLKYLRGITAIPAPSLLPFLGWTVIGHQWNLYIIWLKSDVELVVLGPIFTSWTSSYLGIFKLFHIMEKINDWMKTVYWPWLEKIFAHQNAVEELVASGGK